MSNVVLKVRNLSVEYAGTRPVRALNGGSLTLESGKVTGIVGESGCGKTTLALACIGLLPQNAKIVSGEIVFKDQMIQTKSSMDFELLRGTGISMVFQEPLSSLNPVYRSEYQLAEAIMTRNKSSGYIPRSFRSNASRESKFKMMSSIFSRVKITSEVRQEIIDLLRAVRIHDPESVMRRFPHELSGGMRQRVMIAMSLALRPDVLIADEPTTALDVTTQAKVLALIRELAREYNTAIALISHDLSVIAEASDMVQVMYLGEVVERSERDTIFKKQLHPYTVGLLGSFPTTWVDEDQLQPIAGLVPSLSAPPSGCRFHTRCAKVFTPCYAMSPELTKISDCEVACHLYDEYTSEGNDDRQVRVA